jgi:hypothetical protein
MCPPEAPEAWGNRNLPLIDRRTTGYGGLAVSLSNGQPISAAICQIRGRFDSRWELLFSQKTY